MLNVDQVAWMFSSGLNNWQEKTRQKEYKEEDEKTILSFLYAAYKGDLAMVQWYAQQGLDLNVKNSYGYTALHLASWRGYMEIVRWLLAEGAFLHVRSVDGLTPLHFAAWGGQIKIVKWLLARGASLEERDNKGATALLLAARSGQQEMVEWLLKNGASVEDTMENGWNALICAAGNNHFMIMRYLLENYPDSLKEEDSKIIMTSISPSTGFKALMLLNAVRHKNLDSVKKYYTFELDSLCIEKFGLSLLSQSVNQNTVEVTQWIQSQQKKNVKSIKVTGRLRLQEVPLLLQANLADDVILNQIEMLLKSDLDRPNLLIYTSKIYSRNNDLSKAKQVLNEVIFQYPAQAAEAYFEVGKLEQKKRNFKIANENYDKAIENLDITQNTHLALEIYQKKAYTLFEIGQAYRAIDEDSTQADKFYEEAIRWYSEILKLDKTNQIALNNLQQIPEHTFSDTFLQVILGVEKLDEPTHAEYSYFAKAVYKNDGQANSLLIGWTLVRTAEQAGFAKKGYFGAAYYHRSRNLLVIAHRGTDTSGSFQDFLDDLESDFAISQNELPAQWQYASSFYENIITDFPDTKKFVTGHSLGAFLGALTAWQFKIRGVIFDPPGSLETIQTHIAKTLITASAVEVVSYLSFPDIVNTANHHVGEIRHLPILLPDTESVYLDSAELVQQLAKKILSANCPAWLSFYLSSYAPEKFKKYLTNQDIDIQVINEVLTEAYKTIISHLGSHSMEAIFNAFNINTGLPITSIYKVKRWPSNFNCMSQFEAMKRLYPNFPNGLDETQRFKLIHTIQYDIEEIDANSLNVNQFDSQIISFIQAYKGGTLDIHGLKEGMINLLKNIEIIDNQVFIKNNLNIFAVKQYLANYIYLLKANEDVEVYLEKQSRNLLSIEEESEAEEVNQQELSYRENTVSSNMQNSVTSSAKKPTPIFSSLFYVLSNVPSVIVNKAIETLSQNHFEQVPSGNYYNLAMTDIDYPVSTTLSVSAQERQKTINKQAFSLFSQATTEQIEEDITTTPHLLTTIPDVTNTLMLIPVMAKLTENLINNAANVASAFWDIGKRWWNGKVLIEPKASTLPEIQIKVDCLKRTLSQIIAKEKEKFAKQQAVYNQWNLYELEDLLDDIEVAEQKGGVNLETYRDWEKEYSKCVEYIQSAMSEAGGIATPQATNRYSFLNSSVDQSQAKSVTQITTESRPQLC